MITLRFGAEDHHLDLEVDKFMRQGALLVDGAELSGDQIVHVLDETDDPVCVENGQDTRTSKVFGRIRTDSRVLVVCRSEKANAAWAKVAGKTFEHAKVKPWQTAQQIERVAAEAARLGVRVDPDVPALIHKFIGDDLRRSSAELKKLAILASPDVVTKQTVTALISPQLHADPFDLPDLVFRRQTKRALTLIGELWGAKGAQAAAPFTMGLLRHSERLLLASKLGTADLDRLASRLGLHAFIIRQQLLPVLSMWSLPALKQAFAICADLDGRLRTGRGGQAAIELAVVRIAGLEQEK